MPLVTFVLLTPVLPLQLALLNLSTRSRHDLRRYPFETFEWRFLFRWLRSFHFDTIAFCGRLFNSFHLKARQATAAPTIINRIRSSDPHMELKYWNTPDGPHPTAATIKKMNPNKAKTLATTSTALSRTLTSQTINRFQIQDDLRATSASTTILSFVEDHHRPSCL